MPYSTSLTSTLLFLSIFILAFFPNLFIYLVKLPLLPLLGPNPASTPPSTFPCCATPPSSKMSFSQRTISLPARSRGVYLITPHITSSVPEIKDYRVGILHLFIQHTSCALSLNENWDEDTRKDMGDALDRMVPEDVSGKGMYRHDAEGSDDMPAHIKAALIGTSLTIPITNGKLATGTWQGIWYLEFRDSKHTRKVVATIQGEKM